MSAAEDARAKWLEARRKGLGGSDAAAACGLSPWATPLDLYLDKIGEAEPREETEPMRWGKALEPLVLAEYERRTGSVVNPGGELLVHPDHAWMLANLDGTAAGAVVEAKTTGRLSDEWGDDGTDQVPVHYVAQCVHYMAVSGLSEAHLACLFLADRLLRVYRLAWDQGLADQLVTLEAKFWRRVEQRDPPPATTPADMAKLWRRDAGTETEATPAVLAACERLKEVRDAQKHMAEERDRLEGEVKAYMQDCATLLGPDGKALATWKTAKTRRLDTKGLKEAEPDTWERFATTSEARRFLLK